jgi:hypothetical protein
VVVVGTVGVEELHAARAENLEAVLEVGAGSEGFGAEARAGVIDFKELDGLAGVVADRRDDIRGVTAAGYDETREKCKCGGDTHES